MEAPHLGEDRGADPVRLATAYTTSNGPAATTRMSRRVATPGNAGHSVQRNHPDERGPFGDSTEPGEPDAPHCRETDTSNASDTTRGSGRCQRVRRLRRLRERIAGQDFEVPESPNVRPSLVVLGQALAFDKELSGNRNMSCMTCHHPSLASDDDRHLPAGQGGTGLGADRVGGPIIPRNSPPLFNLLATPTMFWDSRVFINEADQLETPAGTELTAQMRHVFEFGVVSAQAMFPVTSSDEMLGDAGDNELADADSVTQIWSRIMARIGAIPTYVFLFENAYPGTQFEDMSFAHAANAIAGFEVDAFRSTESPWDRFVRGDDDALSHKEIRGALAFFDAGCASCHSGPMFSDFSHHNTGQPQFGPGKGDGPLGHDDFGREQVTGDTDDRYRFRTAPLRNVEHTAPYGHTGATHSLQAFVAHYRRPRIALRDYDIQLQVTQPELWPTQVDNIEAVLATLDPAVDALHRIRPRRIVTFLRALSSDDADSLDHLVPPLVPSGLPVSRY